MIHIQLGLNIHSLCIIQSVPLIRFTSGYAKYEGQSNFM